MWPAPSIPCCYVRACRKHFHVTAVWITDEPFWSARDDGVETTDLSGCLTFEQASRSLLRQQGNPDC